MTNDAPNNNLAATTGAVATTNGDATAAQPPFLEEEDFISLTILIIILFYWTIITKQISSIRSVFRWTIVVLVGIHVVPNMLTNLVTFLIGIIHNWADDGSELYVAAGNGDYDSVRQILTEQQKGGGAAGGGAVVQDGRRVLGGYLMDVSPLSTAIKSPLSTISEEDESYTNVIISLLQSHADPNRGSSHGPRGFLANTPPLFTAVKNENVPPSVVQSLLNAGATLKEEEDGRGTGGGGTTVGPYGWIATIPPLIVASHTPPDDSDYASQIQLSKLKLLLQHGANPNHRSTLGPRGTASSIYPLHMAIGANNAVAAQLLLNHGANVNAYSKSGPMGSVYRESALLLAVRGNSPPLVRLLLKHGADVQLGYTNGPMGSVTYVSPLGLACQKNYTDIASILIGEGNANPNRGVELLPYIGKGSDGDGGGGGLYKIPPVIAAANNNATDLVHLILREGGDRTVCRSNKNCRRLMMMMNQKNNKGGDDGGGVGAVEKEEKGGRGGKGGDGDEL